jgi:hypothetical protein
MVVEVVPDFFSCFSLRFSLIVSLGFFLSSLLPLSRFPVSPISFTPFTIIGMKTVY